LLFLERSSSVARQKLQHQYSPKSLIDNMPHKGKKKYLKADAVAEEQKADSTAGVQIKNGESSALGGTSTKKPRTPSNNGPTSSKKGSGGSSGGGKGDRGGGAGMQHVKSAISRAKSADAVLQACTKGSEGVQSLSVNACCMALYAVAKMTDGGGKGKGGKGKGKGGKGGKGMKGSKVEKDDEDNTTDGTAGSDEQVADSAERWAELLEVSRWISDIGTQTLSYSLTNNLLR
jgi:hypothetical protein